MCNMSALKPTTTVYCQELRAQTFVERCLCTSCLMASALISSRYTTLVANKSVSTRPERAEIWVRLPPPPVNLLSTIMLQEKLPIKERKDAVTIQVKTIVNEIKENYQPSKWVTHASPSAQHLTRLTFSQEGLSVLQNL